MENRKKILTTLNCPPCILPCWKNCKLLCNLCLKPFWKECVLTFWSTFNCKIWKNLNHCDLTVCNSFNTSCTKVRKVDYKLLLSMKISFLHSVIKESMSTIFHSVETVAKCYLGTNITLVFYIMFYQAHNLVS